MNVLYVHGMGRSPLSGWLMLRRLRKVGMSTGTFGYMVSLETFDSIVKRLIARLVETAETHPYVLVGHSLGGVLIRAALNGLPAGVPHPRHVFLLGSPIKTSRLAVRLKANALFRLATRDCGQLLSSDHRLEAIDRISAPTTAIIGTRGILMNRGPFAGELNDGVVSVSEVSAPWIGTQLQIPVIHAWLPASALTADIILRTAAELES